MPFRHRFEVDHEVDASAVGAVNEAPAKDHLATPTGRACLASCETKPVVQTPSNREDDDVILLAQLSDEGRQHVEGRLRSNLMIWLTTVSPSGRPDSVPVWFLLRDDETLLVYSQPGKPKLRNIRANPNVALGLDVTDIGRDVIRVAGLAQHDPTIPLAHRYPAYVAKYAERIGAMFDTPERFGELFSSPIVITPRRIWTPSGNSRALT